MCEIEKRKVPELWVSGKDNIRYIELEKVKGSKPPPIETKESLLQKAKKLMSAIKIPKLISVLSDLAVFLTVKQSPFSMLSKIAKFLKERSKESSTYQGAAAILGVIGFNLSPEDWETISMFVVSVIGIIQMIKKENAEKDSSNS